MAAAGTTKENLGKGGETKGDWKGKGKGKKGEEKGGKGKGEKGKGKGKGPKGGCFHCGGPHYARECPKKGKRKGKTISNLRSIRR